jgi:hypothetical protein
VEEGWNCGSDSIYMRLRLGDTEVDFLAQKNVTF